MPFLPIKSRCVEAVHSMPLKSPTSKRHSREPVHRMNSCPSVSTTCTGFSEVSSGTDSSEGLKIGVKNTFIDITSHSPASPGSWELQQRGAVSCAARFSDASASRGFHEYLGDGSSSFDSEDDEEDEKSRREIDVEGVPVGDDDDDDEDNDQEEDAEKGVKEKRLLESTPLGDPWTPAFLVPSSLHPVADVPDASPMLDKEELRYEALVPSEEHKEFDNTRPAVLPEPVRATRKMLLQVPVEVAVNPSTPLSGDDIQVTVADTQLTVEGGRTIVNLRLLLGGPGQDPLPVLASNVSPLAEATVHMNGASYEDPPSGMSYGVPNGAGKVAMVCCHWKNKGWCKYQERCKFLHPEHKRGVGAPARPATSEKQPVPQLGNEVLVETLAPAAVAQKSPTKRRSSANAGGRSRVGATQVAAPTAVPLAAGPVHRTLMQP